MTAPSPRRPGVDGSLGEEEIRPAAGSNVVVLGAVHTTTYVTAGFYTRRRVRRFFARDTDTAADYLRSQAFYLAASASLLALYGLVDLALWSIR